MPWKLTEVKKNILYTYLSAISECDLSFCHIFIYICIRYQSVTYISAFSVLIICLCFDLGTWIAIVLGDLQGDILGCHHFCICAGGRRGKEEWLLFEENFLNLNICSTFKYNSSTKQLLREKFGELIANFFFYLRLFGPSFSSFLWEKPEQWF